MHFYWPALYHCTVLLNSNERYCTVYLPALTQLHTTAQGTDKHFTPLYLTFLYPLTRNLFNCTPPHIPTESHWGSCTGLWPALYQTVPHCTIHLSKLCHTERDVMALTCDIPSFSPLYKTPCCTLYPTVHNFTVPWLILCTAVCQCNIISIIVFQR